MGRSQQQMPALTGSRNVYGSYVHGIFDAPGITDTILKALCARRACPLTHWQPLTPAATRNGSTTCWRTWYAADWICLLYTSVVPLAAEGLHGLHIAPHLSVDDDLTAHVGGGLEDVYKRQT